MFSIRYLIAYLRPLIVRVVLAGCAGSALLPAYAQVSSTTSEKVSTMLDAASAKALIAPLYQALTSSSPDMVAPLLDKATSPDWMNCSSNDACQTKAQTIQRWTSRIGVVPDMQWTEKEIIVAASHIVARGEVSGTPAGPFLGVVPQGRSFKIMTIDIHQVRDGKIVHTYHLEDWAAAIRQLSTPAGTP